MRNSKSNNSNTGFRGVTFKKDRGKFQCHIKLPIQKNGNRVQFTIGTYSNLNEAVKAREEFIKNLL